MERKRIRDFGIVPGRLETGKRNKITDVPGVKVGHCTVKTEENHTGITVIVPGADNAFAQKYTAAAYVHNGFGKSAGLVQVEELGTLETPIALTNTLNVGKVWDAMVDIVVEQCEQDGLEPMSINPVVGECNDSRINQIQKRVVGADEVRQAFASASEEFEEGGCGSRSRNHLLRFKGRHWFCFPRDPDRRERIYDWRAGAVQFWRNGRFCVKWRIGGSKDSGLEAGER